MFRILLIAALPFSLFGCNHFGGVDDDDSASRTPINAGRIEYNLPQTHATVDLTLRLVECLKDKPIAKASVSLTPKAVRNPNEDLHFTVDGEKLASFFETRQLSISLHDHGGIKSVNTKSTDRSATIIGGFVKLLFSVSALSNDIVKIGPKSSCNDATTAALKRRKNLVERIGELRLALDEGGNAADITKEIDALAKEVARLETGPLQLKLNQTVVFVKGRESASIGWKASDFKKWGTFGENPGDATPLFALQYCARSATSTSLYPANSTARMGQCGPIAVPTDSDYVENESEIDCVKGKKRCDETLVFREPVLARVEIFPESDNFFAGKNKAGELLTLPRSTSIAKKEMSISQWGEFSYLPIEVAFAESRSVSLTLDAFGRHTSFGWSAGAKGEALLGGLNELQSTYATVTAPSEDETLKTMKATVDELATKKALNELEACRAVIEAGGFSCPE